MCKRIEQGAFKQSKGWFFHRLIEAPRFDYRGNGRAHRSDAKIHSGAAPSKLFSTLHAAIEALARQIGGTFAGDWTYHNADSSEALKVLRFELVDDKAYRPIHPFKGKWKLGDPAGPLPLYRLPELTTSKVVFVVEGEKCADALRAIGVPATTSPHGAASAEKSDWAPLAGKAVVILPDNDDAGRKYARDVARLLVKLDPPALVKIVELPGVPAGGDIVEYLAAGGTRESLIALADSVPWIDPAELIGGPLLTCLADVESREIQWLWAGRIALGRITLLVGRPGEGKSFLTIDMAARVTTGTPWPDGRGCPRGSVILVCAEDDPGDTIRRRLDAHHADARKVHLLSAVRRIDCEGKKHDVLFTLADVAALESALKTHPDCRLIVVDPIGSFLGGDTDAHRDNEVRGVLAPVGKLAEKYGPAVLVVAHRRKASGSSADDLALGSRAFTGIARAVWHLSRDKVDRDRRLFLPGKNNLASEGDGLAFTIRGDPPCLSWEKDAVRLRADDVLVEEVHPGPEPESRQAAEDWLRDVLANGPVPSGDLKEPEAGSIRALAREADLKWATIRRAADRLGVRRERCRYSKSWQWRLPKQVAQPSCSRTPKGQQVEQLEQLQKSPANSESAHNPSNQLAHEDSAEQLAIGVEVES
jgi:5S rRNA maturation endonuclease (ribonuclease M5)